MKKDVDYNVYLMRFSNEAYYLCWLLQQLKSAANIDNFKVLQEMVDSEIFIIS